MDVIALPFQASEARDVRDQNRCEAMREMGTGKAADPFEPSMLCFGGIEHNLHVDHRVLLIVRESIVEPVNEGRVPAEVPRSH